MSFGSAEAVSLPLQSHRSIWPMTKAFPEQIRFNFRASLRFILVSSKRPASLSRVENTCFP